RTPTTSFSPFVPPSSPCALRPPPPPTLFPSTTLFRSPVREGRVVREAWLPLVRQLRPRGERGVVMREGLVRAGRRDLGADGAEIDRKSTRLNSSHVSISYAVFCLQKKRDLRHDDFRRS